MSALREDKVLKVENGRAAIRIPNIKTDSVSSSSAKAEGYQRRFKVPVLVNNRGMCETAMALAEALRDLRLAREELAACIGSPSDAAIDSCLARRRIARKMFQAHLIEYRDHYEDCKACGHNGEAPRLGLVLTRKKGN